MRTSGLQFLPNPAGKASALAGNSMDGIVTRRVRFVAHRFPTTQSAMMLYVASWLKADLQPPEIEVRFASNSGHCCRD